MEERCRSAGDREDDRREITIEVMGEEDLKEVILIERAVFAEPWTEALFRQELHFTLSHCLVAKEAGEGVVGYVVFWIVTDEIHLNRIAVKPNRQRRGVATALMSRMARIAGSHGATRATLEVRQGNQEARKLYDKFGFEMEGRRPSYYTDTGEDALILWADLRENL